MYSKKLLIEGFRQWLELKNYDKSSQYYAPVRLAEFLDWMEDHEVKEIKEMTGKKVKSFFEYLSKRKGKRSGKLLSRGTLRNYLRTINRFNRYLQQSGQGNINVPIKFKGREPKQITVLTKAEINKLYEATTETITGIRDRALLAVCYGCGARRNEAVQIKTNDILADKNMLYIHHGKGGRARYVPIVGQVKSDIINYLNTARPMLLNQKMNEYLFVGIHSKSMTGEGLYQRIKRLRIKAGIEKQVGLHSLRHSIATHLLLEGMELSQIAKFLGHQSLSSTQIYTHLKDGL